MIGPVRCPMCDAENGSVAAVEARGYHCTSCGAYPNSTWWYRAERRREVAVPQVDRYRIRERVRVTDSLTEFDAERVDTARRVTLRVYRAWLAENATFVGEFERASALQARLGSQLVVPVDGEGRSDGGFFVALETVGKPALAAIRGARFDVRDVVELVRGLCTLYAVAHQQFVLLGVNPEAILVTRQAESGDPYRSSAAARVRFVAFDVFGHLLTRNWRMSEAETGVRIAQPRSLEYMSPEELMGRPLDQRSDIYGLGVLAYELLVGRKPFPDAQGPTGLITAQLRQTPQPVSKLVAEIPPALDEVVSKCLEKDRNARFADIASLAAAVEALR